MSPTALILPLLFAGIAHAGIPADDDGSRPEKGAREDARRALQRIERLMEQARDRITERRLPEALEPEREVVRRLDELIERIEQTPPPPRSGASGSEDRTSASERDARPRGRREDERADRRPESPDEPSSDAPDARRQPPPDEETPEDADGGGSSDRGWSPDLPPVLRRALESGGRIEVPERVRERVERYLRALAR